MTTVAAPVIDLAPLARDRLLALTGTGEHVQYVRIHVGRG